MYTNAQVAGLVAQTNTRLDAIERAILALAGASLPAPVVGAPIVASAASPVVVPERGAKAERFACSVHPEHKDGKGFTLNGRTAHAAWCNGTWSAIG